MPDLTPDDEDRILVDALVAEHRAQPRSTRTVRHAAADPRHGMTLDELAAFVQAAMREEIPGGTVVKQTATWKSSIKRLEISG